MRKAALNLLIGIVWIAGNLTPLLFIWLIWPRPAPVRTFIPLNANGFVIDFFIALIFPLQHSIWTQPAMKKKLQSFLGEMWERPYYVLSSGVALIVTILLWQSSPHVIWQLPALTLWPLRIFFLALIGVQIYCGSALGAKFLTGIAHLKAIKLGRSLFPPVFKEVGPYRFVRHPIAASQILMLWLTPAMYADRFLLAILWTVWIAAVTKLEDQRLAVQFGDTYSAYRMRAGFLWPRFRHVSQK